MDDTTRPNADILGDIRGLHLGTILVTGGDERMTIIRHMLRHGGEARNSLAVAMALYERVRQMEGSAGPHALWCTFTSEEQNMAGRAGILLHGLLGGLRWQKEYKPIGANEVLGAQLANARPGDDAVPGDLPTCEVGDLSEAKLGIMTDLRQGGSLTVRSIVQRGGAQSYKVRRPTDIARVHLALEELCQEGHARAFMRSADDLMMSYCDRLSAHTWMERAAKFIDAPPSREELVSELRRHVGARVVPASEIIGHWPEEIIEEAGMETVRIDGQTMLGHKGRIATVKAKLTGQEVGA